MAFAIACGSSTTGGSSSDAGAGSAGKSDAAGSAGSSNDTAGSSNAGTGGAVDGGTAGAAEAGGTGGSGGTPAMGEAGAGDMTPSCTPATFQTDCPAQACKLVSGCSQNVCQYTAVTVCVSRATEGTFSAGILDQTVGTLTLHGNLGPFRSADGTICIGTTCVTGGISP